MKRLVLALTLTLSFAYSSSYTLEYLLRKAKDSPNLNIKRTYIMEAKENVNLKQANFYPNLSLALTTQYQDTFDKYYNSIYVGNQGLPTSTSYQNSASIILRYDIFTFGKDTLELKSAKESVISSTYDKCSYYNDLELDILNEYEKALSLKDEISLYLELIKNYELLFSYSKALFKSGEMDAIKVKEYETTLLTSKAKLNELNLEAKRAISTLSMLSGVKIGGISEILELSDEVGIFNFSNFENSSKAKFLNSKLEETNLNIQALEKRYYPTISLYARYDFYGNDKSSLERAYKDTEKHGYEVGVTFRWELFDGGTRSAKLNKEKIIKQRTQYEKDRAKLEYEKQVSDINAFIENASETKELLKKSSSTAKISAKNIDALYRSGERSKLEILEAKNTLLQKEFELKVQITKAKANHKRATILSSQHCIDDTGYESKAWWKW